MSYIHERNIKIWNLTQAFFNDLPGYGKSIVYKHEGIIRPSGIANRAGHIHVLQKDTLDAGRDLLPGKVAVLNMADPNYPGGIVAGGAITQEEDLFRRSDYYKWLTRDLYPLYNVSGIWTENVIVNRKSSLLDYIPEETPYMMNFIAVPAVNNPVIENNDFKNLNDIELMQNRCDLIFKIAIDNNVTKLVLSAWGCGAFKCPIPGVISIFNNSLSKWRYYFDDIVFAILGRNFDQFKAVLN